MQRAEKNSPTVDRGSEETANHGVENQYAHDVSVAEAAGMKLENNEKIDANHPLWDELAPADTFAGDVYWVGSSLLSLPFADRALGLGLNDIIPLGIVGRLAIQSSDIVHQQAKQRRSSSRTSAHRWNVQERSS